MGRTFKPDIGEDGTHRGFAVTVEQTKNYAPLERLALITDPTGSQGYYQAQLAEQGHAPDNQIFKPDTGPKR